MKFFVENMTCGGCAKGVTASIKSLDENAVVNINIADKLVDVESQIDTSALLATLADDGWNAEIR